MSFELTKIDPHQCSIEELDKEIERLEDLKDEYFNLEQSVKIFINSIYGAVGSPWFECYNWSIAEAVTLQGQDLIKYANKKLDEYFLNLWHNDKELHEELGITYANKIAEKSLVIYNDTDSCDSNTIIDIQGKENSTIEKFYNKNIQNENAGVTGHEFVKTDDKILNWSLNNNLYYAPVKRIIRHKVTKPKWKIKTKSGKEIIVTNDHSMIVFRNNKQIEVKPAEILKTDKILCIKKYLKIMEYYFDTIESCEQVENFKDEYVYDIEVDDNTHTFIANDILVHNSTYVTFEPLQKSCDYKGDMIDFILKIKDFRLTGYLRKCFNEYAEKFNTKNYQDLELEKISYSSLMIAKKKYILDLAWKEPGVRFKPQEKIKSVGIEIMQGSTPPFARSMLKTLLHTLFSEGKELKYTEIVKTLKYTKQQFILQDPNDISKTVAIGDYEKYVLEDKKELKLGDKCPINVRASAIYNHKLLNNKFKTKYNLIKTGDKIKYYYAKASKDENAFGFLPNLFPYEFAPEIDYDLQFEKVIVEPFNRYMMAAGFNAIPGSLIYARSLF